MSTQITLNLPDEVYRRAENMARLTGRSVADVLAETVEASLSLLGAESSPPIPSLSDREVLALADSSMDEQQGQRLSELLDRQQAGTLTPSERFELLALMQAYDEALLRRSIGLAEAVRRGLRPPVES
jgi:hypothetical protein